MFNQGGYSLADIAAATGNERNDSWGEGGAWWIIILFLFVFMGNGFGGFGNRDFSGALTRGELCQDMNFQSVENAVRGIQQGLCDGFYAMNTSVLNGFHGVDNALCNGFYTVNNGIQQARFDSQQCCCETNRNIDNVRFENSRNTCDIVNAIKEDGEATRALITANQMQDLRDKLADRDREIMASQFQLSQQAQNQYLVNQIKPCPIPAYLTCSPYESGYYATRAYDRCGCGNY